MFSFEATVLHPPTVNPNRLPLSVDSLSLSVSLPQDVPAGAELVLVVQYNPVGEWSCSPWPGLCV